MSNNLNLVIVIYYRPETYTKLFMLLTLMKLLMASNYILRTGKVDTI